jgi:hypothetical protein
MTDILDNTIKILKEKVGGLVSVNFGLPSDTEQVNQSLLPGVFVGLRPTRIDFDDTAHVCYSVEVICRVIIPVKSNNYSVEDELSGYRKLTEIIAGTDSRGMIGGNTVVGALIPNKTSLSKAGGSIVSMSIEIDYNERPNEGDVIFSYLKRDATATQFNHINTS